MHSSICDMYWVKWCSIYLCSIGGGSVCSSAMGICAFFYMCNLLGLGVVVLHKSVLDLRGSTCYGYMCILLYVKLIVVMVLHRSMLNWRRGWG